MSIASRKFVSLFGFLVTAAYYPFHGGGTSPKWAVLWVLLPICLALIKPAKFTALHLLVCLFLGWSLVTQFWGSYDGYGLLFIYLALGQAFVLGSRLETLEPLIVGLGWGLVPSTIVVLIQRFYDQDIVWRATTNSGAFMNSGSLAEIAGLVAIGLIVYRRWFVLALIVPCLIIPESRGAWLGLAGAATVWLWQKDRRLTLVLVALFGMVLEASISVGFKISSIDERLDIWRDAINGLTWLGNGNGSFYEIFPYHALHMDILLQRPEHAHNDLLEIAFETGLPGFILALAIAGSLVLVPREVSATRNVGFLLFGGFLAEGLVGFPLHMPATGALAMVSLGFMCRDWPSIRSMVERRRGPIPVGLGKPPTRNGDRASEKGGTALAV